MVNKTEQDQPSPGRFARFRSTLRLLYHSQAPAAQRFQFAVLIVDLAIIAFFVATPLLRDNPSFLWIDYSIAGLLALDFAARALASTDILRWLRQLPVIVDIFILLTLLAPTMFFNLGFLRILRLWTLSRSANVWRPLKKRGLGGYQDTIQAVINLLVFLFVVTGFVYTAFANRSDGIAGYVDALYFTVTTITTTGLWRCHPARHLGQAGLDHHHDYRHLAVRAAGAVDLPAQQGEFPLPAMRAAEARSRCRALQGLRAHSQHSRSWGVIEGTNRHSAIGRFGKLLLLPPLVRRAGVEALGLSTHAMLIIEPH